MKGSCASVKVEARHLGHTEVTTTYKYGDHKLTASVIIAAYKPLQVRNSVNNNERLFTGVLIFHGFHKINMLLFNFFLNDFNTRCDHWAKFGHC